MIYSTAQKRYSSRLSYAVLITGIMLSLSLAWEVDRIKQDTFNVQLTADMKALSHHLSRELLINFESLYELKGFVDNSEQLDQQAFNNVATGTLARHPQIRYLQWVAALPLSAQTNIPLILQNQRYQLSNTAISSNEVRVYPLIFSAPNLGEVNRLGQDVGRIPELNSAFQTAVNKGQLVMSSPFIKTRGDISEKVFVVTLPVFRGESGTQTARSENIKGFIVAGFNMNSIIREVMSGSRLSGLHLSLIDLTALEEQFQESATLYQQQPATPPMTEYQQRFSLSNIGNHQWQLLVAPSEGFVSENKSDLAYIVMLFGLVVTGLLSAYLRMTSKRAFEIEEIVTQRTHDLHEVTKQLKHISQTDELTDIANRRHFDHEFDQEWKRTRREQQPISLVLFDLDFFKQYNDHYGHLQGDECLINISELIKSVISRPGDLFARFGGEEFVLLLPNTPIEGAMKIAEECRQLVESISIPHQKSSISEVVTISAGVYTLIPNGEIDRDQMLDLTDQALYLAKEQGRNRVVNGLLAKIEIRPSK
ncbi:diguanylate cyclase (GGDEF) domain-containing protein [Oceanospirillum multiglobuliferum]|uniref:diguanylate cyclase n=1 Tax=Oceanospirillum multiglobuliferum TaxID=64969 RepID=A0A1T4PBZ7_9GAMM|nr:diguanylate cyclase [Oceanospirillum multiglobuliferum]OPX55623.1 hypothetical protein BTE48_08410 [Oceanospirillum multiglobuliferum]SJZ88746.1 diguanylate cyclase (GGDEF) domain-containing protein [Oceanospirillum multiglobuliferum]